LTRAESQSHVCRKKGKSFDGRFDLNLLNDLFCQRMNFLIRSGGFADQGPITNDDAYGEDSHQSYIEVVREPEGSSPSCRPQGRKRSLHQLRLPPIPVPNLSPLVKSAGAHHTPPGTPIPIQPPTRSSSYSDDDDDEALSTVIIAVPVRNDCEVSSHEPHKVQNPGEDRVHEEPIDDIVTDREVPLESQEIQNKTDQTPVASSDLSFVPNSGEGLVHEEPIDDIVTDREVPSGSPEVQPGNAFSPSLVARSSPARTSPVDSIPVNHLTAKSDQKSRCCFLLSARPAERAPPAPPGRGRDLEETRNSSERTRKSRGKVLPNLGEDSVIHPKALGDVSTFSIVFAIHSLSSLHFFGSALSDRWLIRM
jgi:hypothetical protein